MSRVDWRSTIEHTEPLKGQLWTRSEAGLREPDVHWAWRGLAVGVAIAESALLAWLWFGPALAVQTVQVVGAQHLTRTQVARAAGLVDGASVLSVDGESDRQRLLNQTWVRSATVLPQLPGAVLIRVSEWQPIAAYHAGKGAKAFLLSDVAVVLGPASSEGPLVDVQGPAGADPRVGAQAIDPALLTAMVNMQRGFPGLIGQEVAGFVFDSCGQLTLVAKRGWKVYFGRVLTPEEFATLHAKLTALKAIAGSVNYNSADLDYVNVMNPAEAAVGYKSLQPKPPAGATPPANSNRGECMQVIVIAIVFAVLGVLLGLLSPVTIPITYARYTAVALLAALDSIFGAYKAYISGTFEPRVFFSGLLTNMTLAAGLTYFGDKLGVDLSIAAIVAFGVRIFNNLGAIRRHYL